MLILLFFAFLAGIVTILSPCILPVLPIVLSSTLTGGKKRPLGIMTGFVVSFTFFTLFLTTLVKATDISADLLRNISVVLIALFGASLLVTKLQFVIESFLSRITRITTRQTHSSTNRSDILSGLLIGISLGLIWTPCVGPILASIITLAATSSVTSDAILITFAYSLGTAIPMTAIVYGGRQLLQRVPWLTKNTGIIQKVFGILMILTALLIYLQLDRQFQSYILEKFPNYGVGLTKIEDNPQVKKELQNLKSAKPVQQSLQNLLEPALGDAPGFVAGGQWFNSKPLTMQSLRGKVVLVDFWTYTCINCIRTLPYIKSWWIKYKDKGLVIVGVHTPEFEFEKNPDNVARAVKDFGLLYPIMQDNNYATWTAYNNQYWPAKYFIDVNGKIRYTHFGEGDYDTSENWIQQLLKEGGLLTSDMPINNPTYTIEARTPETYLGYKRIGNFVSPEGIKPNSMATYSIPQSLDPNEFAFDGTWIVTDEWAAPESNAKLSYRFNAKNVYLVMRPKQDSGKVRVFLDGKKLGNEGGEDIKNGLLTVDSDRLYTLVKLKTPGEHTLTLEFLDHNLELYAFTFG